MTVADGGALKMTGITEIYDTGSISSIKGEHSGKYDDATINISGCDTKYYDKDGQMQQCFNLKEGASATALGSAMSMGVDPTVVNSNMPYYNAWIKLRLDVDIGYRDTF